MPSRLEVRALTGFVADAGDFDRWVIERVLSPAAPLHYEATTLLAEDPTIAGTSRLGLERLYDAS